MRGVKRRSNPDPLCCSGLLRGACHRARIRAIRWLAMTLPGQTQMASRRDAPELCKPFSLGCRREQGMPGAWCARSRAWCVVSTRVSHHGHTGNTRHSPRNGFNGFLRDLPGDRALLSPSSAENPANLNASVGASGPHDFAVRLSAVRQRHRHVHRIPPRVCDDRETPLRGTGQGGFWF